MHVDLNPDIFYTLQIACTQQKSVKMVYYTASRDAFSERKVDPYSIRIYRGQESYMLGYCHFRCAIRNFRIDRIQTIELLEETFTIHPSYNPENLKYSFQYELGSEPFPVTIWFSARAAPYIRERTWHFTQKIQQHSDGSLTLKMFSSGLNDIKRFALYFGKESILKEPPNLLEIIQQEVLEVYQNYFGDPPNH